MYIVSSGFAFSSSKGHVGEKLLSQLIISSRAHNQSAPIILTEIRLGFSGGLKDVKFQHDSEAAPSTVAHDGLVYLQNVSLQQATDILNLASTRKADISPLLGISDLTFAPGTTRVLSFDILPRISGNVEATSVTMCIQEENFDFEIAVTNSEQLHLDEFWYKNETRLSKKRLASDSSIVAKILSKPPKMHIEIPNLRKSYLADEIINLDVKIVNKEEEATEVMLEVQLLGRSGTVPKLKSASKGELSEAFDQNVMSHEANHSNVSLPLIPLGQLEPTEVKKERLSFQARPEAAEYILDIKALYHLLSDPDTSISKTFETEIVFVRPFEANYSLLPRIHPDPWPNYFSTDGEFNSALTSSISIKAGGLIQKWLIIARIASFAAEALAVEDVRLQILEDPDDIVCKISQAGNPVQNEIVIKSQCIQTRQFDIELQKYNIEDRQSTALNLQLEVQWRRENSDAKPAITRVAVSEIIIPFGEPRVLAFARKGEEKSGLIHLDYMIENPSRYVLRFSLTMETSEEFAFSGPKSTSVQLVPLSRHIIRYNVLPLTKGVWISPYFRVVDIHFNKTLKVNASEGVTSDAKGIHIWVDDEDSDDDNG